MNKKVNTVCGPIDSDHLGITLIHEHILFELPAAFQGDTPVILDWDNSMKNCIDTIKPLMERYGLSTIVDATPTKLQGRNVSFLKAVSEATGINIVAATGYLGDGKGDPADFIERPDDAADDLYKLLRQEVAEGIDDTGIKAGVIKLGTVKKNDISEYEKLTFKVAAKVSAEEGIPIITHTQDGTMAPEQADLLLMNGADPNLVSIGHIDGTTDIQYYLDVLAKGVYINFDRFGLQVACACPMDTTRELILYALCAAGYADRIMLSHDTTVQWIGRALPVADNMRELLKNRDIGHIFRNSILHFKKLGINDEHINRMLTENPRQFFGY